MFLTGPLKELFKIGVQDEDVINWTKQFNFKFCRHCSNITYGLFMATSCCVFGSLSYKYEKPIVVITTASGGSLAFLYGKAFFYIYFVIPLM